MSFNNLMYDKCSYNARLNQSTSILGFIIAPEKYQHDQTCLNNLGLVGGSGQAKSMSSQVDLETELMGRTRTASSCPQYRYTPGSNGEIKDIPHHKLTTMPKIDTNLIPTSNCSINNFENIPYRTDYTKYEPWGDKNKPNNYEDNYKMSVKG
jgi:hypothetical protein